MLLAGDPLRFFCSFESASFCAGHCPLRLRAGKQHKGQAVGATELSRAQEHGRRTVKAFKHQDTAALLGHEPEELRRSLLLRALFP